MLKSDYVELPTSYVDIGLQCEDRYCSNEPSDCGAKYVLKDIVVDGRIVYDLAILNEKKYRFICADCYDKLETEDGK